MRGVAISPGDSLSPCPDQERTTDTCGVSGRLNPGEKGSVVWPSRLAAVLTQVTRTRCVPSSPVRTEHRRAFRGRGRVSDDAGGLMLLLVIPTEENKGPAKEPVRCLSRRSPCRSWFRASCRISPGGPGGLDGGVEGCSSQSCRWAPAGCSASSLAAPAHREGLPVTPGAAAPPSSPCQPPAECHPVPLPEMKPAARLWPSCLGSGPQPRAKVGLPERACTCVQALLTCAPR